MLRIHLLGSPRATRDGSPGELRIPRTAQSLLAYLLLHRHRRIPREVLAARFWGDQTEHQARACLSTTLWRLRSALEPDRRGLYLVTAPGGETGFDPSSDYWLDTEEFESRLARASSSAPRELDDRSAAEVEEALALYSGEFLEGFYDEWVLEERARLHRLFLGGLYRLTRYHAARGDYERGLECGQRALSHDPLREEVHRELMLLHARSGRRSLALQQYRTCREILAAELGVTPSEEIELLYRQLAHGSGLAGVVPARPADPADPEEALRELRAARRRFDRAWEDLQQALLRVEELSLAPAATPGERAVRAP